MQKIGLITLTVLLIGLIVVTTVGHRKRVKTEQYLTSQLDTSFGPTEIAIAMDSFINTNDSIWFLVSNFKDIKTDSLFSLVNLKVRPSVIEDSLKAIHLGNVRNGTNWPKKWEYFFPSWLATKNRAYFNFKHKNDSLGDQKH